MAASDYSVIKPLESVQTIQGLAPAQRRQERKRRQDAPSEHHEQEPQNQLEDPQEEPGERPDENGPHLIDYCA